MKFEQVIKVKRELFESINEFNNSDKMMPNPCWKGYEPVGLKPNGAPNCVPKKHKMDDAGTQVSSESFDIPKPKPGEGMNTYIGRCMNVIGKENKPHEQLVAICVASYKKK